MGTRFRSAIPGSLLRGLVLVASFWLAGSMAAWADEGPLSVRVYNVSDIVAPTPSYPFDMAHVPTAAIGQRTMPPVISYGGAGGGGFGGAGGGGFGGGGFGGGGGGANQGTPRLTTPARFSIDSLREVVERTIAPDAWGSEGASCNSLDGLLIVRQTEPIHKEIESFLAQLRKEGGLARTVEIHAYWLLLAESGVKELSDVLVADRDPREATEALGALLAKSPHFEGELTCFDRQTVHIISGRGRTVLQDVTPVISAGAVAADPQIVMVQTGALLEATAMLDPAGTTAVLDLRSTVTGWEEPGTTIEAGEGAAGSGGFVASSAAGTVHLPPSPIDRVNLVLQQFATTLRVPIGRPVVAGGLTLNPERAGEPDDPKANARLLLVVAVSLTEDH